MAQKQFPPPPLRNQGSVGRITAAPAPTATAAPPALIRPASIGMGAAALKPVDVKDNKEVKVAPSRPEIKSAPSAAPKSVGNIDLKSALKNLRSTNESEATANMARLSDLTKNARASKRISQNKGTIQELLGSMKTKPKFSKMVEYSIECLKNLAVDETSVDELLDEGVIEVFLMVRKLNPYNEKIAHMMNQALNAFCLNDRLAARIAQLLGPDAHLFSLRKHVEPQTLISTCTSMTKIMRHKPNIDMFVKAGCVPAIATVVQNNLDKPPVVAAAAGTLVRVAGHSAEYAAMVVASGAIENILKCVSQHGEIAELVQFATDLVGTLAKWGPALIEALKKMGAIDVLVAAVEMHPNNKIISGLAANVFKLMTDKNDIGSALNKVVASQAATSDTASALAKISSLLLVDENVDWLVKNQGIGALISALQQALNDQTEIGAKVLESGCRALMRCAVNENQVYDIIRQGGVQLLLAILNQHMKDEKVVASALSCLAKLCSRKENAQYLANCGVLEAAFAALKAHPNSQTVARAVLDLLTAMAQYPELVPILVQKGALAAILDILANHGKDPEFAKMCIDALGKLCNTPEHIAKFVELGGLARVIETLNQHGANAEIAKSCILLIEALASVATNIDLLKKLGAVAAILNAMEKNKGDAVLQALGKRALDVIAGKGQVQDSLDNMALCINGLQANFSQLGVDNLFANINMIANLCGQEGQLEQLLAAGVVDSMANALAAALKLPAGEQRSAMVAQCAKAFVTMCKNADAARQFVKNGGLLSLLRAALADIGNEELAEHALEIAALCAGDPANRAKMIADGNIEDILALMKAYPFNEKVLMSGLRALAALIATPEGAKRFLAAGGAEVLIEALKALIDDPASVKLALDMICALAVDDEAIAKLLAAGAIDAILLAMRKYPQNSDILTSCMKGLCALMNSEKVAVEIGEKGGIPLLIGAMRTHYTVESLVEIDVITCDSLCSVAPNIPKFLQKDLNTLDLVKWSLAAYGSKNQAIAEAAQRIITALESHVLKQAQLEAKAKEQALIMSFDDAAADLLIKRLGEEKDAKAMSTLLNQIMQLLDDEKNAQILLKHGGLQALAKVMKSFEKEENVYYAASEAFLALSDKGGDQTLVLLEEPWGVEALCSLMDVKPTFTKPVDPVLLQRVLTTTAKMKLKRPESVQQMLDQHVLESLLKLVAASDNPVILAQATKLLAKLSNNDRVAQILAKMASVRELIAAMRKHFKNEEFLRYGVFLLGNLAQNDELKSLIGIEGGIQLIMLIMESYPTNEPLIENCCYALANLSFHNEVNVSFIVACKGIFHLLSAIKNHPRKVELLEPAVCTLCNLCHKNDSNKDAICKQGGAQAIVDCLLANFNSIDLILTGFRTLGNLAFNSANISIIIKSGGVQAIVAGMTVHAEEQDVIDIAIRVLTNLASDLDEENMSIMAQEGAVQAVVDVAHKSSTNVDLEIPALGCLCNLARENYNASMIIRQAGTEAVCAALRELAFDAELADKASRLLSIMAVSDGNQDRVIEGKAVTGAMHAMKQHPKNRAILTCGLKTITALSYNDAAAIKIANEGAFQFVFGLINANIADSPMLIETLAPLSALARAEAVAAQMADPSMKAIISITEKHPQDLKLVSHCLAFVANLCVHAKAAEFVTTVPLVRAILAVLKTFKLDPPVIIRGLRAMENIAFASQPVRDHMKVEKCIEACQEIKERHSIRDDIVKQAQAVIDAINRTKTELGGLVSLMPREKKTAKELFGDNKQVNNVIELSKEHKNLLLAGALLQKHSSSAAPRTRHIYVTQDLKWLVWKDPKKAEVDEKQKMKTFKIRSIERGRATPNLKRTKTFGGYYAKEECSFAILGRERSVDLECGSEAEREKWVVALQHLIAYLKEVKAQSQKFTSR